MHAPPLDRHLIADTAVREPAIAGRREEAMRAAAEQAAAGMSYQALLRLAGDRDIDGAVAGMESALNIAPTSQVAFHNLVATLLQHRRLKGPALQAMKQFMARQWTDTAWLAAYRPLLWLPRWMNVEFVSGRCNLKCRMCLGTNSPTYPDRFQHIPAADFRCALDAAPTVDSITLSSGDSDPFLHPEILDIIDIAADRGVLLSFFTNGLPLSAKLARGIIDSQAVEMVNFSIDAATPETYANVRGGDFERLTQRIAMLAGMKRDKGCKYPNISFSFVAMQDTIAELPDFVSWAGRSGAVRVLVEDLIGWEDIESDNVTATAHPRCFEFVAEAMRRAETDRVILSLPQRLKCRPVADAVMAFAPATTGPSVHAADAAPPQARATGDPQKSLPCCGWIDGLWVQKDGRIDPCCLVHDVADMGNAHDGPVIGNAAFGRVKSLLMDGKVFPACAEQRMCEYVQQQHAAGKPLRFITTQELGTPPRAAQIAG